MTEVADEDWDFTPWTPEGAARLRAAAQALAGAVLAQAEAVIAAAAERVAEQVFDANDVLRPVVLEFAEAQFDFTGIDSPVGNLDEIEYDGEIQDGEVGDGGGPGDGGKSRQLAAGDGEKQAAAGISVLQRRDYAVLDEEAVLATGRAAYRHLWPDDDEATAEADVTHLGRALYHAAHAGEGFADLDQLPGLAPAGGALIVIRQAELLTGSADDWPEQLFDTVGEQLYEMQDVYLE